MLNTLLNIGLTPADSVNVVDSTKAALSSLKDRIAEDPSGFFADLGTQALHFGLKVLVAIVIYIIGAWIIKRVKKFLTKFFEKKGTDKTIATFVGSLVSITLTILLIIITISQLGINTTSLAALLAAGGVAIGMAMSGTVQNFAGGLMILAFKPFKVGDFIKVAGYEGTVTEVNIVCTKIKTIANSTIILPNGALSNGNIDNFSHKPCHRVSWTVNVAYGSDPDAVRAAMLDVVKGDERILDSSTEGASDPVVALVSMNDSTISFALHVWVKVEDFWPVTFKYNEELYKKLPAAGIQFAFPQVDVHITNRDLVK